ncbi:MAG: PQQ-binding-like beta-propeller repeat protein, partial [Candidatus Omnitrophica bacterium]|nr:PQQ-binding-like beta-propeller repeat protein [Candidatus Omnitrophota bacterium]
RRSSQSAYSTPCIYQPNGGQPELIFTSTAHGITAVDGATGKVKWEMDKVFRDRCVSSPVMANGLVIAGAGYGVTGFHYVAVRPGSSEDGSAPALVYEVKKPVPLVPTPLVVGDRLFLWGDNGQVSCLRADTGELVWRERLEAEFYSSPVCVNHRIYCVSKEGEVFVLAVSDKLEILARMQLGEPSFATPAVSGGVMYLRTYSHLISIGGPKP